MNSKVKPAHLRTSRVTTLNLIKELESGGRIKVLKEGWRQGQSHHLVFNDKNEFDKVNERLSNIAKRIEKLKKDETEITLPLKKGGSVSIPANTLDLVNLCLLVRYTSQFIKNESDQQVLYNKILQLMVNISIKSLPRLTKKFAEPNL